MKRIKVTEKQYDKIISELYESTYNSASDKVMGESDLDYWKDYAESKKQSDERAKEGGILGKLLSDTKMDKNENVYTKWFPTRFAVEALMSKAYFPLFKEFAQYCKEKFGLMDKADIYMIWLDYTHSVVKMIPDQTVLKELYKSTYNSAASEAMERGDEELALDFLKHSNEMGIDDNLRYDTTKIVHKDGDHVVLDLDQNEDEFTYDEDDISYQDNDWLVIDMDDEDKTNYDFYGVGSSDMDADGIPDDVDDELSVDRFDIKQRIQSELNTMLNEESKGENYMFFSNLKQMRRQLDIMINEFDSNMVNDVLNNGHDWADDHITEAKVNIDQVFDFFMNKLKDEDGVEYKDYSLWDPYGDGDMLDPYDSEDMLEEKWSEKYKKSIDCNNPKGFSQRAHCQGRKNRN